jgi:hypothetical protein
MTLTGQGQLGEPGCGDSATEHPAGFGPVPGRCMVWTGELRCMMIVSAATRAAKRKNVGACLALSIRRFQIPTTL